MKNFQLIVIIIFVALAVFGVLVFSGAIPLGKSTAPGGLGTVVLWGTVKVAAMTPIIEEFNTANPAFVVKYVQKSADTFDHDLLEALATGNGPDLFFLPDNLAFHYANKIFTIPYTSYPLAAFRNNFASAGEVFLTSTGALALPLTIDPLMLYYNRSTLDAEGIVYPPSSWEDVTAQAPKLTKKDGVNKISKSAFALGQFSNVANAKDILSTLFMQTGNTIVSEKGGIFSSNLNIINQKNNLPQALKFYTDFADPNNAVYSWNRSFPNSTDAFSAENLAFYFGFASELPTLINRNPNQNFGVAPVPQVKNSSSKVTMSHVTGISILASSKNLTTAFTAANLLSTGDFASKLALATGQTPARRDLLNIKPTDAFSAIFYNSALFAKSWLDPSSADTKNIFSNMVEGVLSNAMTVSEAIADASTKLGLLFVR